MNKDNHEEYEGYEWVAPPSEPSSLGVVFGVTQHQVLAVRWNRYFYLSCG